MRSRRGSTCRRGLRRPGPAVPRTALPGVSRRREAEGRFPRGHARRGLRQARHARPLANAAGEGQGGRDAAGSRSRGRRAKTFRPSPTGPAGRWKRRAARRVAEGRVVLRRLNRVEYENTVRDLLGIDVDLKDRLPAGRLGERLRQHRRGAAHLLVPDGEATWRRPTRPSTWPSPTARSRRRSRSATACKDQHQVKIDDRERVSARWTTRVVLLQLVGLARRSRCLPVLPAGPRPLPLPHLRLRVSERRQAGHLSRRRPARRSGWRARAASSATSTPRPTSRP